MTAPPNHALQRSRPSRSACHPRALWAGSLSLGRSTFFLLLLLLPAIAQEDAELPPPPKRPGVQITFLPPPLTGTLSLGIYTKAGKLVRTLHREARTKDFVVGLNGLMTWWDGKNDAGAVAPAGNYYARGFAVGAVSFQGEAFHCNDWIDDDDSPRLQRISDLRAEAGGLRLIGVLANGRCVSFAVEADGRAHDFEPFGKVEHFARAAIEAADQFAEKPVTVLDGGDTILARTDDRLLLREKGEWRWLDLPTVKKPVHGCLGRDGTLWVIDRTESSVEVQQYSFAGEFRRRLAIAPEDPAPVRIAASLDTDAIALIEESPGIQRVRMLSLAASEAALAEGESSSTWKVTFSKTIRACDDLAAIQSELKTESGAPFAATEKFNLRLLPNQLVRNASPSVDVSVGFDAKGSFLRTSDGLALKRITETTGLKWVAMMREPEGKAVTIFQSDGAVVEEFKARKLANMMAFDAGEYEWAGR